MELKQHVLDKGLPDRVLRVVVVRLEAELGAGASIRVVHVLELTEVELQHRTELIVMVVYDNQLELVGDQLELVRQSLELHFLLLRLYLRPSARLMHPHYVLCFFAAEQNAHAVRPK